MASTAQIPTITLRFDVDGPLDVAELQRFFYYLEVINSFANAHHGSNRLLRSVYYDRTYQRLQRLDQRLIRDGDNIRILQLRKSSPLELEVIVSSATALLTFVKVIQMVFNMYLARNKDKRDAERHRAELLSLELDNKRKELQLAEQINQQVLQRLERQHSQQFEKLVSEQLAESKLELQDVAVEK